MNDELRKKDSENTLLMKNLKEDSEIHIINEEIRKKDSEIFKK